MKDPYQKLNNTSQEELFIGCNEPSCELFVPTTKCKPGDTVIRHHNCLSCKQFKIVDDERYLVDVPYFLQTKAPAQLGETRDKSHRIFDVMLFWSGFLLGAICAFAWCMVIIYFAPQNVIHSLPTLGY